MFDSDAATFLTEATGRSVAELALYRILRQAGVTTPDPVEPIRPLVAVAAEHGGAYDATSPVAAEPPVTSAGRDRDEVADPSLPAPLVELLSVLRDLDRLQARAVELTLRLRVSGEAEAQTGLGLLEWLEVSGRMTAPDRKTLLGVADVLQTMPQLTQIIAEQRLTWSQLRGAYVRLKRLRIAQRATLDGELAGWAVRTGDTSPDEFVSIVDDLVAEARADREVAAEQRDAQQDLLVMQPRIDGTGGTLFADLTATSFAIVGEAISDVMGVPDGLTSPEDDDDRRANTAKVGHAQANALVSLCAASLGGRTADGTTIPARPLLLLNTDLIDLLALRDAPGRLLTTLAGGELRVTADLARRLADTDCDLRLIVTEGGRTVGVGRRHRAAPDWLRHAVLAGQVVCAHPGCNVPARRSDLDHNLAWEDDGTTDAANLAWLCRRHHTPKTLRRTDLTPADEQGDRTWTHPQTGLSLRIPPDRPHRRRPPLTQPPSPAQAPPPTEEPR